MIACDRTWQGCIKDLQRTTLPEISQLAACEIEMPKNISNTKSYLLHTFSFLEYVVKMNLYINVYGCTSIGTVKLTT